MFTAGAQLHRGLLNSTADWGGYRCVGYAREVTVEWSPDPGQWVTELQQPIDSTGG